MRDWPLLLVTAAFCFGAAARYIAEDGLDSLAFGASLFAAASFGAWLYSVGVDKERDHHHLLPVKKKKEKEKEKP